MEISIRRRGGLRGNRQRLGPVDTANLEPSLNDQLRQAVEEMGFFELPSRIEGQQHAEMYMYAVTIVDGDRRKTVDTIGRLKEPYSSGFQRLYQLLELTGATFQDSPDDRDRRAVASSESAGFACEWTIEKFSGAAVYTGENRIVHVLGEGICPRDGYSLEFEIGNQGINPDPGVIWLTLVETAPDVGPWVQSRAHVETYFVDEHVKSVLIGGIGTIDVQEPV